MMFSVRIVLLLLVATFVARAQENQVSFSIHAYVGDAPLVLNTPYRSLTNDYYITPTSLRYYLSQISITHDGGIVTPFPSLYILMDHSAPTTYQLGSIAITHVESFTFYIGVDTARNHLDPTTYPPYHPLSPQDPTMHWGWTSGYRFMAYNLLSGADTTAMKNVTEIHGLGDANYHRITVAVPVDARNGKVSIDINANVAELLQGIDVRKGLYEHSDTGPAKTMLNNAAQRVFSASSPTSVDEDAVRDAWMEEGGTATIYDLRGALVRECNATTSDLFDGLHEGAYIVVRTVRGRVPDHRVIFYDGR